jgi:hypothetical protein
MLEFGLVTTRSIYRDDSTVPPSGILCSYNNLLADRQPGETPGTLSITTVLVLMKQGNIRFFFFETNPSFYGTQIP